jgi:hypothetical protein
MVFAIASLLRRSTLVLVAQIAERRDFTGGHEAPFPVRRASLDNRCL